ncbi:MAG: tolB protein precursor protein [Myxococcota bacterium]
MVPTRLLLPFGLTLTLVFADLARAQVFVYPRRADKSHVINFDFDWRHIDILVGPKANPALELHPTGEGQPPLEAAATSAPGLSGKELGNPAFPAAVRKASPESSAPPQAPTKAAQPLNERAGGVRLYFYERERAIAERAAASITSSYRELAEQFHYVPTRTFPYILYSSYQEFLQTNLFPLQEGVLGVTSPEDLKLTLPYLGDHQLFQEVSTHEMVHQFTIQKLKTLAETEKLFGSPLMGMPLWFIEGIAEYYAHRGIPPDAEMLVRDIVVNPDMRQGYAMLDFFEDRPYSVLWTYKGGNVRCAFLEETYGKGFIQKVLDSSGKLLGGSAGPSVAGFSALLEQLSGDDARSISEKFQVWLKRKSYRTYLDTQQDGPQLRPFTRAENLKGIVLTMTSSPDGNLLLYRSIQGETGDSLLVLVHKDDRADGEVVTIDGVPGIESLHPIADRNFDVTSDKLAFVAETRGRDVLYVQDFEVNKPKGQREVSIELKGRRTIRLGDLGVLAVYSPSFSPGGKRLAFIGMNEEGQRDLYVIDLADPKTLVRLTFDVYGERQLSWGPQGIVYSSDATSHRRYNLFLIHPDRPRVIERLTTEERDVHDPKVLSDGRVFFVSWEDTRANLHELVNGEVVRRTDVSTALFDPSAAPDGSLWALVHRSGQRHPVELTKKELLHSPPTVQPPGSAGELLPRHSLEGAQPYQRYSPSNWEMGPLFGIVGGGTGGIAGQLFASAYDRLRNHAFVLNLGLYGSFDLADGVLLYVNQEKRVTYGAGFFQSLRFRDDKTFADLDLPFRFSSGERFFGLLTSARYPFNRFVYAQADVGIGGVNYFLLDAEKALLEFPQFTGTGQALLEPWRAANQGTRFQTEGSLRLGADTLRYHYATGPIAGGAVLLEGTLGYQPQVSQTFGHLRLDAERYFSLGGRTNFLLRVGSGMTAGGRLAREFYLSSYDTLRGVPFADPDWLLGRTFLYSTAELQFPLNDILRVLFLTDLEGIAGFDFGGVGERWQDVWDKRVLSGVLGVNFGVGPLVFRLHFAKNIDTGAPAGLPVPANEWVTNFSIGIAGLGGLWGDYPAQHTRVR